MGFISDMMKGGKKGYYNHPSYFDVYDHTTTNRNLWREAFGVDKESGGTKKKQEDADKRAGGSFGRSATAGRASFEHLLRAMRSKAPGGWSDDRYEESFRHFKSIAYVAINRICTQWQQAEFQVYKRDEDHPDGKRPISKYDPPERPHGIRPWELVKLLEKPNWNDSWGKLLYRIGLQKYLTGTGLIWMVPNALGVPYEMYCIPTAIAIPQPAVNPEFPDGYYRIQPVYPYGPFSSYPTPNSAVGAPVPAQWMLRVQNPHPILWYDGYSPLTALSLHLDEVDSIDRSRWYKMKRTLNPSAVLDMSGVEGQEPLPEEEIERIRAELENDHEGPENVGRLFVSAPGCELKEFGTAPKDMEYKEGWDQLTSFCMGGFGITKPAAGMIEGANYANLWAALKQLHALTLKPDLDDVASVFTRHLASYYGDDLIVEIRCPRIDDHDLLMAKIDKAMQGKAITKNQLLKLLDFPVTKEKWGEEIAGVDPQQEQQQGMPGATPPQPGMPEENASPEPPPLGQEDNSRPDEERSEPIQVERERPVPGDLGIGSGMPKEKMIGRIPSVLFDYKNKILTNGNGKH